VEIAPPSDPPVGDSDINAEVSTRRVSFKRQLDYLVDGRPFTLRLLDRPALKKISALISFLD
jgi:hypothetical protein